MPESAAHAVLLMVLHESARRASRAQPPALRNDARDRLAAVVEAVALALEPRTPSPETA